MNTPYTWSVQHAPAAGSQATISKAAGTSPMKHVATAISFGLHTVAAPVATTLTVALRDGASGAGSVLWSWSVRVPASADANIINVNVSGLNVVGSAATAMTLEFSAALANTVQWVNLTGYDLH